MKYLDFVPEIAKRLSDRYVYSFRSFIESESMNEVTLMYLCFFENDFEKSDWSLMCEYQAFSVAKFAGLHCQIFKLYKDGRVDVF